MISSKTSCSQGLCWGRYQKFSIAEDIDLVVRCELDGVISMKGQDQLLSIKALNEYDSKTTGTHTLQESAKFQHALCQYFVLLPNLTVPRSTQDQPLPDRQPLLDCW